MSDRQNTGIPFPDELEHLSYVRGILEEAMEKAEADVDRKDREYMKQKRYMVEYRGEIDPHEMFQSWLYGRLTAPELLSQASGTGLPG